MASAVDVPVVQAGGSAEPPVERVAGVLDAVLVAEHEVVVLPGLAR
jgi:hypothetical protein